MRVANATKWSTKPAIVILFLFGALAYMSKMTIKNSLVGLHNTSNTNNSFDVKITPKRSPMTPQIVSRLLKFFSRDPDGFVASFLRCAFHSPSCRIYYHHVQKTGGSRLASRLHPVLSNPLGQEYDSTKWCCHDTMMDRFRSDLDFYCEKNKFGIYEVLGPQLADIVKTCTNHTRGSHVNDEVMVVMTIREPIQRTLSSIHHQCNKNYKKPKKEKLICERCSFESDPEYFLSFVEETNKVYKGIVSALLDLQDEFTDGVRRKLFSAEPIRKAHIREQRLNNTVREVWLEQTLKSRTNQPRQIMILDQADINNFFSLLEKYSPSNVTIPEGKGNEEKTKFCSLGMTSSMMRALSPALEVYRNLTGGLI